MIKLRVYLFSILFLSFLFTNPVFAQKACNKAEIFAPLIGEWDGYRIRESESDSDKINVGSLSTKTIVNGCALAQIFTATKADKEEEFDYQSFGFVDETGYWSETVVLASGMVRHYIWEKNEEELILRQQLLSPSDRSRIVIFDILGDQYQLMEEHSSDRGQTWTTGKKLQFVRKSSLVQ